MNSGQLQEAPRPLPPARDRRLLWAGGAGLGLVVIVLLVLIAAGNRTTIVRLDRDGSACAATTADTGSEQRAARRLAALRPRGRHLVIDTFRNRLRVYDGETLLREAVCSTGSGSVLVHPSGEKTWVFDTPLGERRVVRKVRDPIWTKPDWAFVEEGFEPPTNFSDRIDRVSLGDYALYLGDGYIIHGTLFQTLLGQGVTHGCVRLGDEDLEYVFKTIPVGARVYLY
ncbi:MAG TPA: L,D-transpeptidase [Chondromyces sp.]|nr:L,D-transpeptidase [Chondromyces sp.]